MSHSPSPVADALPHDIAAEMSVLGSMLLGKPDAIDRATSIISREDFYRDAHAHIFDAIHALHERKEPVDIITLPDELRSRSLFDQVGGLSYIMQLAALEFTTANIAHYARIVRDKADLRRLYETAYSLATDALRPDANAREIAAALEHCVTKHASSLEVESNPESLFMPLGAFLESVGDPPPMLVEGLLPDNSLVLLTGKPKFGKSLLALDMAESVSRGQSVCGVFPVNRPGAVCYLGMEDGRYEIANRFLKRGNTRDAAPENLHIGTLRINLGDARNVDALRKQITLLQPVLLIIDTAREALGVRDYNDAAEMSEKLRPLREFARDVCTVLLVFHNRKASAEDGGDEIAGSNAITSSVDGWISARRKEDLPNKNRRLHLEIDGRGGMRGSVTVEMDTNTTHFRALTDEEKAQEAAQIKQGQDVEKCKPLLDFLVTCADIPPTVAEIAIALELELKTAQRMVQGARQAGLIIEAEPRRTGGKPATTYRPTSTFRTFGQTPKGNVQMSKTSPQDEAGHDAEWDGGEF